jgi:hypothetical protein
MSCLRKTEFVKTNMYILVYTYTKLDENTTHVQRVAQVDPSGWIPTSLIEYQSSKMVDAFNRWNE